MFQMQKYAFWQTMKKGASFYVGKGPIEKKRFLSGIARIFLTPPPHDPNSGNWVPFFRKSKLKIWKSV